MIATTGARCNQRILEVVAAVHTHLCEAEAEFAGLRLALADEDGADAARARRNLSRAWRVLTAARRSVDRLAPKQPATVPEGEAEPEVEAEPAWRRSLIENARTSRPVDLGTGGAVARVMSGGSAYRRAAGLGDGR